MRERVGARVGAHACMSGYIVEHLAAGTPAFLGILPFQGATKNILRGDQVGEEVGRREGNHCESCGQSPGEVCPEHKEVSLLGEPLISPACLCAFHSAAREVW